MACNDLRNQRPLDKFFAVDQPWLLPSGDA
jgi:hypothetical protein